MESGKARCNVMAASQQVWTELRSSDNMDGPIGKLQAIRQEHEQIGSKKDGMAVR
jgi:hypothetical protein